MRPPPPCRLVDGRLCVEDLPLEELVRHAEGRPLWVVSRAELDAVWAAGPVSRVPLAAFGSVDLLAGALAAGHWATVGAAHDLALAREAGFPSERIVLGGDGLDDGALKEALLAGVAVVDGADGDAHRPRLAAMAALLGREPPPAPTTDGLPAPFAPERLAGCGLLLVGVLQADDDGLRVDAPLDPRWWDDVPDVLPLTPGAPRPVRLAGLSSARRWDLGDAAPPLPQEARLHGAVRRGDWVALPTRRALLGPLPDPLHGEPERLLLSGVHGRPLTPWPLPAPPSAD